MALFEIDSDALLLDHSVALGTAILSSSNTGTAKCQAQRKLSNGPGQLG
jgi:hypothetical protein